MSIKKTWFSYILWLLATGFSIIFTYSYITGIITCYSFEQVDSFYYRCGLTAAFVLGVGLLYALFSWINSRIKEIAISKWGRRIFHIVIVCGLTALFVITRCMVLWSTALENIVPMETYEAAKVMLGNGQASSYESYYVFEDIYINILSGLFLFLGNKMEVMLYFQIFLQAASFLLLLFIGRTLQNGFSGWIPAAVYTLSQFCMETVLCLDSDNLWFFFFVLGIAVICFLERAWKNKTVTYSLTVIAGILFSVLCAIDTFPHVADWNSVFEFGFYEKLINGGAEGFWSFLILMVLMCFYCISFWKAKTDNVSAYILPIAAFSVVVYLNLWPDILPALFMLIRIYMSFMVAEGMRILFEARPKVMTKQDIEENEAVTETVNETVNETAVETVSEDTGVIRVSDILKAVNAEEADASETAETKTEVVLEEKIVDKTAMIENVLPMPKKHVSRTFEYAFEPEEDMMHYDVEVENDDYDYE